METKNKLQIVANVLDSPDAMDPGGLNANELESDEDKQGLEILNLTQEKV